MTADLDLSPEAVERLAREHDHAGWVLEHGFACAAHRETAATLRALSAENAHLRAANGDEGGFCGDTIGKQAIGHLREMYRSAFDALGPSGRVSLRNFIDNRLRAERDAAWQAGAEAMRLLWNAAAGATTAICHALDDGAVEDHSHPAMLDTVLNDLNAALAATRDLLLPDQPKEGAPLPLPGQPTNNEENT